MKKYLAPSLLFIAGFIFFGFYSLLGFDLHHDGIMFKAAVDVAAGKVPFRETFCQYGILTPLLQGAFIKIFGAELLVLKLLTAAFYAASLAVFDKICCRFIEKSKWGYRALAIAMYFLLSADCCVTSHPWASVYALFFILLAIEYTLRFCEEDKNETKYAVYSGLCAGIMFGLRQPCGLTAILSGALLTWIFYSWNKNKAAKYAAGFFSAAAALFIVYALMISYWNAWHDYWIQTWSHALSFAVKRGSGTGTYSDFVINFFPFVTGDRGFIDIIFAFFPLITLGMLGYMFLKGEWKNNISMVCVILFALGAWHQYYPVPCMRHLYWAAVPMMIVFIWSISKFITHGKAKGIIAVCVLLLILLMPMLFRGYFGARRINTAANRVTSSVSGIRGLLLFAHEKRIAEIMHNINFVLPPELKQRGVFNHTPDGIWSIILPPCRDFKHPMFCRLGDEIYPDYDNEAFRYCLEKRPVVISSVWQSLPEYTLIQPLNYNGVDYFILIPQR